MSAPDLAGTIRNTGAGWEFVSDEGHAPVGFTGIITRPAFIELQYPAATAVVTFQASLDETLAATSLRVGASVGLGFTRLYLYTTPAPAWPGSSAPANPAGVVSAWGNIWLAGWLN